MSTNKESLNVLYLTGPSAFSIQRMELLNLNLGKRSPFDSAMASMRKHSIQVDYMKLKSWSIISWFAQNCKALFFLNNYDVVFTSGIFLSLARVLFRWKKPRLLVLKERVRTNTMLDYFFLPIIRSCMRNVDKTLCLSSLQIGAHSLDLRIPKKRIVSMLYGIDADFFKPEDTLCDCFILSVGDAHRDDETLIRACENIPVKVIRVSDKLDTLNHFSKLLKDISKSSIKKGKFVLLCKVSDFQLRKLYAQSKLVVVSIQSYTNQPAGLTSLLEAMAMGKAVIVTKGLATEDYVIHGKTGMVVEPGNIAQLRNTIAELVNDDLGRKEIGHSARKWIEENFTIEKMTENLAHLLSNV